jgi:hypothetical protein
MDFLSSVSLVEVSLWVIGFSIIIILISLVIVFLRNRKTVEEKHAEHVLDSLNLLRQGKSLSPSKAEKNFESEKNSVLGGKEPVLEIRKDEASLKQLLVKKFKPKIEQQLNTKVEVLDFNAKENVFLAFVEISGVKILLTLDSAGKIIDYKKIKV